MSDLTRIDSRKGNPLLEPGHQAVHESSSRRRSEKAFDLFDSDPDSDPLLPDPSSAHPDYFVVLFSHKNQTFFLDFETLTAHGGDERPNLPEDEHQCMPLGNQLKYYSGTKKVCCQLETRGAGGLYQLVLSVQDYRCHKHE